MIIEYVLFYQVRITLVNRSPRVLLLSDLGANLFEVVELGVEYLFDILKARDLLFYSVNQMTLVF